MRRLVKFALIVLPILVFYFWSYLGLGILGIILIIFRILTWKHEPKITKKEMITEDDDAFHRHTSLQLKHTFSATNINNSMYDN